MADPLLQLTITLFLSVLFAITAWHKWQDINDTASVVAKYQLLPIAWCYPIAYAVASTEALIVVLLWLAPKLASILAIILLFVYGVAIFINLHRGRTSMDCGCGGIPILLTPLLLVRNTVLIIMTLLLLAEPNARNTSWAEIIPALIYAFILVVLYHAGEQLLSNRGRHIINT